MSSNDPQDTSQAPAGWSSFLKTLSNFRGDLSSLTAPPSILSGTSLCEYPAYWAASPKLFAQCAEGKDDVERMGEYQEVLVKGGT